MSSYERMRHTTAIASTTVSAMKKIGRNPNRNRALMRSQFTTPGTASVKGSMIASNVSPVFVFIR